MTKEIDPLNRDTFYTDFEKSDDGGDKGEASARFFTRLCKVLKKTAVFKDRVIIEDAIIEVEPVEYVEIVTKKYSDVYIGKATDEDRARFATAYKKFLIAKAGRDAKAKGPEIAPTAAPIVEPKKTAQVRA